MKKEIIDVVSVVIVLVIGLLLVDYILGGSSALMVLADTAVGAATFVAMVLLAAASLRYLKEK